MRLREVLELLARGEITVEETEKALRVDVVEKVGSVARLDLSRSVRRGVPEIVLAEGKSNDDFVNL
jgi:NCAIR mutase (PurE)-related protein